ncbi:unnamed protein product, partial [Rotaria sp. Silwood2]
PFNIQVLPHFEPNKVIVDGPGIRNGIPASLETHFRIDTRDAGFEQPDVLIKKIFQIQMKTADIHYNIIGQMM